VSIKRYAGLIAVTAMAGLSVLTAGRADATVAPTPPPVVAPAQLTISGPTTPIKVRVPGTTSAAWLQTTIGATRLGVRGGYAVATLPSTSIRLGESALELDQRDGRVVRILVTAKRTSRVSAPMVAPGPLTGARISGIASHYDPRTGGYVGDSLSPVMVQKWQAGRWTTLRTATTARSGGFTVNLALAPGGHVLRLVRPVGATVTGGTGVTAAIVVPTLGGSAAYGY